MSGEIVEVALGDPFPGPRPLQAEDRLFGRDDELLQLHDLLVAHRIVLLYSPSGAGKSSLLEAGLRPMLEEERFHVVGPLRVGLAVGDHDSQLGNPYLSSVVASLPSSVPADGAAGTADGLKERLRSLETDVEGKPLVLVFDQFEELLTTTVGDDLAVVDRIRAESLQEIGDVLRDKSRWAVFAMREDYIAALDPFLHLLPTQLSTRFRIDLLRHDQALEAVKGPVSELRPFQDDAAEALVTDLRMVRMPQRGGGFAIAPGRFVEPLHLQLVCRRLWHDTTGQAEIRIEDVRRGVSERSSVDGGKDARPDLSSVERALSDYYAEQVGAIGKEHRVDEGRLRDWFDGQLIVGDHRGRTLEGPMGAAPPDDPLLEGIVDTHLVRTSTSADAVWYELAHDRLIEPVTRSNRDWRWRHGGRFRRMAAVVVLAVFALGVASAIIWSRRGADHSDNVAWAASLSQRSLEQLSNDRLDLALLFGSEAVIASEGLDLRNRLDATNALLRALQAEPGLTAFLAGHESPVLAVAIAPDGKTVATGDADGTVILHDTMSGEQRGAKLTGHAGAIRSLAIGGLDGTTLASGGADGTVILRDTMTGEPLGEPLAGHANSVNALAFGGPDGTTVASGGADGNVILHDATGEAGAVRLEGNRAPVLSIAFGGPDGTTLASAGADGTVTLWDAANGQRRPEPLLGHRGPVNAVAIGGPDGTTLASGGADGTVILWDATTGERRAEPLTDHSGPVLAVAFSPDGTTLASGGVDRTIIVRDATTGRPTDGPLTGHNGAVNALAFGGADGRILASGGADGTGILWDVGAASGRPIGDAVTEPADAVRGVAIGGPNGTMLAAGGANGTVSLWDTASGQQRPELLSGHAGPVDAVAVSPDGRTLATGGADGTVTLQDATSGERRGEPLTGHRGQVLTVAFSPDGRTLASGGADGTIILRDATSGEQRGEPLTGDRGHVLSVAIGSDGRTLASGGADGTVNLWDAMSGERRSEPLTGHRGPVNAVALTPDGRTLASGGADGAIVVWDVPTGKRIGALRGDMGPILSIAIGPDWTSVASKGDGSVIRWETDADALVERACRRANRSWSENEQRLYFPGQEPPPTCEGPATD